MPLELVGGHPVEPSAPFPQPTTDASGRDVGLLAWGRSGRAHHMWQHSTDARTQRTGPAYRFAVPSPPAGQPSRLRPQRLGRCGERHRHGTSRPAVLLPPREVASPVADPRERGEVEPLADREPCLDPRPGRDLAAGQCGRVRDEIPQRDHAVDVVGRARRRVVGLSLRRPACGLLGDVVGTGSQPDGEEIVVGGVRLQPDAVLLQQPTDLPAGVKPFPPALREPVPPT